MKNYNLLKKEFEQIAQLNYLCRILSWEEAVMMPQGAGPARAEALSTLKKMSSRLSVSKKIGTLIHKAKKESLPSFLDRANLNLTDKYYQQLDCVPPKLLEKLTKTNMEALQAWRKYKPLNNWKDFCPVLEKSFLLQKTIAEIKSQKFGLSPYDTLIDNFASGLTQRNIDKAFAPLLPEILSLRNDIIAYQEKQKIITHQDFPLSCEKQKQLFHDLMKKLYFDFNHGRFDECSYAYCDGIATDMRITMDYDRNNFLHGLFAVLHETGHAVYEQSMPKERCFQLVGQPQCKLIHESMAFLYEKEIGLSIPFFKGLCALINKLAKKSYSEQSLYVASTYVQKNSLIRVTADEVNYPLHIMLRYEIEKALFNEDIKITDVPSIWNEKMLRYFGISTDENYKDGPMQDVHWPFGYFGYFPIYLCAQLLSSQIFEHFTQEEKNFTSNVEKLNFSAINHWLKEKVYQYGGGKTYQEILSTLGEKSLTHTYFIQHLKNRYLQ